MWEKEEECENSGDLAIQESHHLCLW